MRLPLFIPLACVWQLTLGAAVFNWPDPLLDAIDNHLYVDHYSIISVGTLNCATRDLTTVGAQWLRIAFHDFGSYNGTEGTGGLDASIIYELDRPQASAMLNSFSRLLKMAKIRMLASDSNMLEVLADTIAMGAIAAVVGCGGPVIPYRAGRIDATEAGPETVPEPQQDLPSHIAAFKRLGFNETDMIGLVACGHTLGGVRQVDFPTILPPDLSTGVAFQAPIGFNNSIVHEYLDSTTINVLEVGPNITTRSDLRIFSSDNNVTMQRLASPVVFNQVCTDLIERMINTVPNGVTLTDVVEPIDYKVSDTMLFPQGGSLAFLATMRVIDPRPLILSFRAPNKTVTMFWKERQGTSCPKAGCSAKFSQLDYTTASTYGLLKGVVVQFEYYRFNASIDLNTSISHFWFEVDPKNGSAPFIVDNHGANYTIDQDVLLYDPRRSNFKDAGSVMVVALKDQSAGQATVSAKTTIPGSALATYVVNTSTTAHFTRDPSHPPADGYTFYSSPISDKALSNTLHATVGGKNYSLWVPTLSTPGV
ncbi:heme peroxidase [Mycena polygramma]|nr:heme peroxidase [Mycena polygramma]